MRDWIGGIATWISQGLNCALLKGSPDMTVSARCYINRDRPRWRTAHRIINALFFWQKEHCKASFRADVVYATRVLTIHNDDKLSSGNPIVRQSK